MKLNYEIPQNQPTTEPPFYWTSTESPRPAAFQLHGWTSLQPVGLKVWGVLSGWLGLVDVVVDFVFSEGGFCIQEDQDWI